MPPKYRDPLAGGLLVALPKRPTTGIRPIDATDGWRRITAKGLLQNCLREYEQFFQQSHPKVFQFATATPDGATIMFNSLKCIIEDVAETNSLDNDPIVMGTFDTKIHSILYKDSI